MIMRMLGFIKTVFFRTIGISVGTISSQLNKLKQAKRDRAEYLKERKRAISMLKSQHKLNDEIN